MGDRVIQRILNVLICLDQLGLSILTLGASSPDETMSAAAWRTEQAGKLFGRLFRPMIDWLFRPFERYHCRLSYEAERQRSQLPKEYST